MNTQYWRRLAHIQGHRLEVLRGELYALSCEIAPGKEFHDDADMIAVLRSALRKPDVPGMSVADRVAYQQMVDGD